MTAELNVHIETDEGIESVVVDLSEDLGELSVDEFELMNRYVAECGLEPERAMAGAAVVVLLSRKAHLDHDSLIEAVTRG